MCATEEGHTEVVEPLLKRVDVDPDRQGKIDRLLACGTTMSAPLKRKGRARRGRGEERAKRLREEERAEDR